MHTFYAKKSLAKILLPKISLVKISNLRKSQIVSFKTRKGPHTSLSLIHIIPDYPLGALKIKLGMHDLIPGPNISSSEMEYACKLCFHGSHFFISLSWSNLCFSCLFICLFAVIFLYFVSLSLHFESVKVAVFHGKSQNQKWFATYKVCDTPLNTHEHFTLLCYLQRIVYHFKYIYVYIYITWS